MRASKSLKKDLNKSIFFINRGIGRGFPDGHQGLAYLMHQKLLEKSLGIEIRSVTAMTTPEVVTALQDDQWSDIVVVMVDWRDPCGSIAEVFKNAKKNRPERKLVYLDFFASTSTPNFPLLEVVDVYAKRQVLKDRSLYQTPFEGGTIFTDFLARKMEYNLHGWFSGSVPTPDLLDKLVHCWNLGVTPVYRILLFLDRFHPIPWRFRYYDVNSRIAIDNEDRKKEWYEEYRSRSNQIIQGLKQRFRLTKNGRIGFPQYIFEMFNSKVVFSPFGWGELCFRDYEAIYCGCLLVKPSMDHVVTSPDIFEAGITYVPVKWDLSDLIEKIEYYLSHTHEAEAIVKEGQRRLRDYYRQGQFVGDFLRTIGE